MKEFDMRKYIIILGVLLFLFFIFNACASKKRIEKTENIESIEYVQKTNDSCSAVSSDSVVSVLLEKITIERTECYSFDTLTKKVNVSNVKTKATKEVNRVDKKHKYDSINKESKGELKNTENKSECETKATNDFVSFPFCFFLFLIIILLLVLKTAKRWTITK